MRFKIRTNIFERKSISWNADELTQENRKFDRIIVHECYYCSKENVSAQLVFDSVDVIEQYRNEKHSNKPFLYFARILVARAEYV